MTASLSITINGANRYVAPDTGLQDILLDLGIVSEEVRGVAVAINDEIVRRADWEDTVLNEGDRVEVVTARQGG